MLPRATLPAICGALLAAAPLWAHHSFTAEFDSSRAVTLRGTITKVAWMNPHVFLYLDVVDTAGKVAHWEVESSAPNGLLREGWTKSSLATGDRVTIEGYLSKDQEHFAKSTAVILPGGRRVLTGAADDRRPNSSSR